MNFKKVFTFLFLINLNGFALATNLNAKKEAPIFCPAQIAHLVEYKGCRLGVDPSCLDSATVLGLKFLDMAIPDPALKKEVKKLHYLARPLFLFKKEVKDNKDLLEAVYHADDSVNKAMQDLAEVKNEHLNDPANIKALFESENFLNVMTGVELVTLALQNAMHKKKYFSRTETTQKGCIFVNCIKAIVSNSLQNEGLKESSKLLPLLETLKYGPTALDKALAVVQKSWSDPRQAIQYMLEIRVLVVDICNEVPEIHAHAKELAKNGVSRSTEDCFKSLIDKLKSVDIEREA